MWDNEPDYTDEYRSKFEELKYDDDGASKIATGCELWVLRIALFLLTTGLVIYILYILVLWLRLQVGG